ncbi:type II secretion system F family protein [archaeon]|nr:type II secretion system F family protein [archaeon]
MKITPTMLIGPAIGMLIIVGGIIFLLESKFIYFIITLGLIVSVLPFVISVALENSRLRELDTHFLEFVRDLVENVKSGTPISKAVLNVMKRDYDVLTPYVLKLGNQVSLGIPLEKALKIFAADTGSSTIGRSVSLISEAQRAGGEIVTILNSVSQSVNQTEVLKKEQKASVYNLVVQGYIIFIVFIIIILVLQLYILPLTAGLSTGEGIGGLGGESQTSSPDSDLSQPLFGLLLAQAFFAGLVIGKISEGNLKAGVKHSFILLALALLISSGASALFAVPKPI